MNFHCRLACCILLSLFSFNVANSQSSYRMYYYSGTGNPSGINTETDNTTSGWTAVTASGNRMNNSWSPFINISSGFNFKFLNNSVSGFRASQNGLLTFNQWGLGGSPALPKLPTDATDNQSLPSTTIPDKTIACFWDRFTNSTPTGADDIIYYKMFGSAPNRQLWIKWVSFEMGGPFPQSDNYFAIVLEETTNKVYMVDMQRGAVPSTVNTTVGIQTNNFIAVQYGGTSQSITSPTSAYTDNNYYECIPKNIETYSAISPVYYNHNELTLATSKNINKPKSNCLQKTIQSAGLYALLNVGDEYKYGKNTFSASVTLRLIGYDNASAILFDYPQTISIDQDAPEQLFFTDIVSNYSLLNSVSVVITSYTPDPGSVSDNNIKLSVWMDEEYKANVLSSPYDLYPLVYLNNITSTSNPVTFSWTADCKYISAYELQILKLYNSRKAYENDVQKVNCIIDWSKAMSMEVSGGSTSTTIMMAEGSGYYAWRVRPLGTYFGDGTSDSRNWGKWSSSYEDGTTVDITSSTGLPSYLFYFQQSDQDKNWIYSRSFSENNGISESMSYADGLQKLKQSQHHLQSDNSFLVSQSLYDYVGRNTAKALAAPVTTSTFSYQEKFITSDIGGTDLYTADDFDADANYNNPSAINGGTLTEYYSDSNPDQNIPAAGGYPFSRTLLDQTGRLKEVGSVGDVLRLGSTSSGAARTVKTYYGSVADDELVRIFGNEAPVDTSVYKVVTIDPNKVVSVSYIGADGKTIATCLSETGENPLIQDIQYNGFTVYDTIKGSTPLSIFTSQKEKSLIVNQTQSVSITYSITPNQIQAECGNYCSTCDYTIYLYVKNATEDVVIWDYSLTITPVVCGSETPTSYATSVSLDEGSYLIGRKITSNNTDAATQILYLEEHENSMADSMLAHIQTNFDTLFTYLETDDLSGFYQYLVSNYASVDSIDIVDGNELTITSSCCSLAIPVQICDEVTCSDLTNDNYGNIDFEGYLFDYWKSEDLALPTITTFFRDAVNDPKYPVTATHRWTGQCSDANKGTDCYATVYFKYDNGDSLIFVNNVYVGNAATLAIDIAVNIGNQITAFLNSNWDISIQPYEAYSNMPSNFNIELTPNGGAPFSATLVVKTTGFDVTTSDVFTIPAGSFINGQGAFNAMVQHMISDGYDCDSLFDIWKTLTSSAFLTYASIHNIGYSDLLESFVTLSGKQYAGISNHGYGVTDLTGNGYDEATQQFGYGYLEYAYRSFDYDTALSSTVEGGAYATCEDNYGFVQDAAISWAADNRFDSLPLKTWEQFYQCVNGSEGSSFSNMLSELGLSSTGCGSALDIACITALAEAIEDSCLMMCQDRYESFLQEAKEMYVSMGMPYTDSELFCIADELVENCKNNCTLTVFSSPHDTNGDGIPDVTAVDSVGSPLEINNMTRAMVYSYDMAVPTAGICPAGYDRFYNTWVMSDIVLDSLIEYLNYKINTAAFLPTNISAAEIQVKLESVYASYNANFSCDLSIPPGTNFNVDAASYFSLAGNFLNLNHTAGLTTIFNFTSSYGACQTIETCEVCFTWKIPYASATDTLALLSCEEENAASIADILYDQLKDCKNKYVDKIADAYLVACVNPDSIKDTLALSYSMGYHQYTLYYYDRAGNLVKTIPPKGVDTTASSRNDIPAHTYATLYEYNSNQSLVTKQTPDAGSANNYYNSLGQLRFSQNAKQLVNGTYSYIKFDYLSRVTEAGESNSNISTFTNNADDVLFPTSGNTNRAYTVYTTPYASATYTQNYLLNRISYVYSDAGVYTYYSYDPHGNVEWMVQYIPVLGEKYIAYEYDLISNKVTKVKYNEGNVDQFFHRYSYDADNRLTKVETSSDDKIWDADASYEYYAYGPLKRTTLGEDKVQGLDYVYTLQGWLKGINYPTLSSFQDPGKDGYGSGSHTTVAPDAFGCMFNYYNNDFNRSGSDFNSSTTTYLYPALGTSSLYTGFISGMVSNNSSSGNGLNNEGLPMASLYTYDELGRLVTNTLSFYSPTHVWNATNDYYEHFAYDKNGNIDTLKRNGYLSSGNLSMDEQVFNYTVATNKLQYIADNVSSSNYTVDIDNQSATNYDYDLIGNLTKDEQENISKITWTTFNKVDTVYKTSGEQIVFAYDGMRNRISKQNITSSGTTTTYYVNDAKGSQMALYESDGTTTNFSEAPIYGASRVGLAKPAVDMSSTMSTSSLYTRNLGKKLYELKDHLSNVRAVVTDIKNSTLNALNNPISYAADIASVADFSAYGMQLSGRCYNSDNYRYGFNGKEKDDEIKGNGNSYDFGARLLDPRVGRWLSLDPMTEKQPGWSPYKAFYDNPIKWMDPDGQFECDGDCNPTVVVEPTKEETVLMRQAYANILSYTDIGDIYNLISIGGGVASDYKNNQLPDGRAFGINGEEIGPIDLGWQLGAMALPFVGAGAIEVIGKPILKNISKYADTPFKMIKGMNIDVKGYKIDLAIIDGRFHFYDKQVDVEGLWDLVVTKGGELKLGSAHTFLAEGEEALLAGQVYLDKNGMVKMYTNASGHFQPTYDAFVERADEMFEELGINMDDARDFDFKNFDDTDAMVELMNEMGKSISGEERKLKKLQDIGNQK